MVRDILRGSAYTFFFKILGAASLFLTNVLIVRHFGAETLGCFNLLLNLLIFFSLFSRIGLDIYVVRILPEIKGSYYLTIEFLKLTFKILIISCILISIILFIASALINDFLFNRQDMIVYLRVLALIFLPYTLITVVPEIFRGFGDIKRFSILRNFSFNFTLLVFVSWAIVVNSESFVLTAIFLASIIVFIVCIITLKVYLKSFSFKELGKKSYDSKILKHSSPMMMSSLMIYASSGLNLFLLGALKSEYEVGIYSGIMQAMLVFTYVSTSIASFTSPRFSEAYGNGDVHGIMSNYYSSLKLGAISLAPIFLVYLIYSKEILTLVFGSSFAENSNVFLILSVGYFINALTGPTITIMNMTDNQRSLYKILIIIVPTSIVLTSLSISIFGLVGMASSVALTSIILNLYLTYYITKKIIRPMVSSRSDMKYEEMIQNPI